MSQYLDKDGATRIAENFLSKQAEQDAILRNLQFDLKEAEHALVKTIQGPAPLNIRALSRPLDDYMISGNSLQNGTPTPEAPVDVVGCGVRTGNLVDPSVRISGVNISSLGRIDNDNTYDVGYFPVIQGNTYTIDSYVYAFYNAVPATGSVSYDRQRVVGEVGRPSTFTAPITGYCCFRVNHGDSLMANSGSTALPYEPYGYKLPLTVNGTEYPIYLGQVESTRKVKKLVLTGNETVYIESGMFDIRVSDLKVPISPYFAEYCNFYISGIDYSSVRNNNLVFAVTTSRILIHDNSFSNVTDFKAYLTTKYAAGTPVTVWYVLATPEIAVVNEPLHKIGDYADTISMAQAGVTLTTTKGFNTITTDTTVLPSNIEVKGVINNA